MGLRTDPYLDRAFDRHSRGRHCNRPYVALLYGRPLLLLTAEVDRAFSRPSSFQAAGALVGFEVLSLAGLWRWWVGDGVDRER